MSRVLNLKLTEGEVVKLCTDKKVTVSAVESLPDGGTRLVCSSVGGAETMRSKLRRHLIAGDVRRTLSERTRPLW